MAKARARFGSHNSTSSKATAPSEAWTHTRSGSGGTLFSTLSGAIGRFASLRKRKKTAISSIPFLCSVRIFLGRFNNVQADPHHSTSVKGFNVHPADCERPPVHG